MTLHSDFANPRLPTNAPFIRFHVSNPRLPFMLLMAYWLVTPFVLADPVEAAKQPQRLLFPWRINVHSKLCWVGAPPNPPGQQDTVTFPWTPDRKKEFGGIDDPEPQNRFADNVAQQFRPKAFIPKCNPFYVALPCNDLTEDQEHKPQAAMMIPWFAQIVPKPGVSVCKGRWLQIFNRQAQRSCYAQWEGCGPGSTDDWDYVFGKSGHGPGPGIGVSPAIRDYLDIKADSSFYWRFVEERDVPFGPWKLRPPPPRDLTKTWADSIRT